MKRTHIPPNGPPRLTDGPGSPLANLVKGAPEETPLSQLALARIHRRILAQARAPRRVGLRGVRFATVLGLLVLGATAGVAGTIVSVCWIAPRVVPSLEHREPESPEQPKRHAKRAKPKAAIDHTPVALPEPAPAEQPKLEVPSAPVPLVHPQARIVRSATQVARANNGDDFEPPDLPAAPVLASTPIQEEARFIAAALGSLRRGHRASAINELRTYLRTYPAGAFFEEANVALLTALVESGALGEARSVLESSQGRLAASPTLRVLQAELAFETNCAVARHNFEELSALSTLPLALRERAAYGAAMAEWRCGSHSVARERMQKFIEDHPQSRRRHNILQHLEKNL